MARAGRSGGDTCGAARGDDWAGRGSGGRVARGDGSGAGRGAHAGAAAADGEADDGGGGLHAGRERQGLDGDTEIRRVIRKDDFIEKIITFESDKLTRRQRATIQENFLSNADFNYDINTIMEDRATPALPKRSLGTSASD